MIKGKARIYSENPKKLIKDYTIQKKVILSNSKRVDLTVALPIYNSKKIAWIAFESLVRQVGVNFSWELIIAEEDGSQKIGDTLCLKYLEALKDVGCSGIVFLELKEWMPLFQKWMLIYKHSSIKTSNIFMLQAADCFSQVHRLRETMDIFTRKDPDWVQTQRGHFYNIPQDSLALYDHRTLYKHANKIVRNHPCCLNMAIKHDLMSSLEEVYCSKGVDSTIFRQIEKKKGKIKVILNESDSYLTGIDTDGYNNLSLGRRDSIRNIQPPYVEPTHTLEQILPRDILKKLKELK